jgi:hypothetical protein
MIPTREDPTPFVIDGQLKTLAAIDDYFAMVRAMFPMEFADTARRYFYDFDDPTKTLNGLYDAGSGERLDKDAHYEYQWTFERYCQEVVGRKGYQPVGNKDLVRLLKAYWGLRNLQAERGLSGLCLDTMAYFAITMGAALQSLSAVKGQQSGRNVEDWAL